MHPAIQTLDVSTQTVKVYQKHFNGTKAERSVAVVRHLAYRSEPASTRNPVRKDGTRAPSPYHIHLLSFGCTNTACEMPPKSWGWGVSPVSQIDAWSNFVPKSKSIAAAQTAWRGMFDSNVDYRTEDQARTAFLNKLADRTGLDQASLGVATGEFRDTVSLATELARGILDGVKNISRKQGVAPKLVSDVLSVYGTHGPKAAAKQLLGSDTSLLANIVKGWLTYQFGLKPVYNDLIEGSALLNRGLVDGTFPERFTVRVRAGAENDFEKDVTLQTEGHDYSPVKIIGRLRGKVHTHFSCVYRIPVRPGLYREAGFDNSMSTAWELCRYSWLVDRVLEVGPWLRSLGAVKDCQFVEGSVSTKCESYLDERRSYGPWPCTVDPASLPAHLFALRFERKVLGGMRPAFLPSLNVRLGTKALANALSALTVTAGVRSRGGQPPTIRY